MAILHRNRSFAARLTIPITVATVATFLTAVALAGYLFTGQLLNQASDKSAAALETSRLYLNESLKSVEEVVKHNVNTVSDAFRMKDTSLFSSITRDIIIENKGIIGSIIAVQPYANDGLRYAGYSMRNKDGRIIYSNINSDSYDYTAMDWYVMPLLLRHPIWSEVYYDDGGGNERMTTYSCPVIDDKGNVLAILTADISLDWLTQRASSIKPYRDSYNLLISKCGTILSDDRSFSSGETIFSYALERDDSVLLKCGARMLNGVTDMCEIDFEGDHAIATFAPLDNEWAVLIVSDFLEVLKPAVLMDLSLLVILMVGVSIVTLICVRTIKRHTRPLTEFARIVNNIGNGMLDNKLPDIKTKDEIMTLRDAICSMQDSMRENYRYRKDLQAAKYIQASIVPEPSMVNSVVDLNVYLHPAREVGGDLYDYHWNDSLCRLFVTVGDVAGKGLPASLMMSMVVSSARLAAKTCSDAAEVVGAINENITVSNNMDMFVTLQYCVIDPVSCEMEICNAGHNPPILIDPDGTARYIHLKTNLVIGAMEGFPYEKETVKFEKGSRLLFYTDGVTEAERPDKHLYGEERLLEWASSLPQGFTTSQAVESLCEDVKAFAECRKYAPAGMPQADGYAQNDDITIMMIKF